MHPVSARLIQACFDGNISLLKQLLEKGVDVNGKNESGVCAIPAATFNNHHDVVVELLRAKANVNELNQDASSILAVSCTRGNSEITRTLQENNASIYVGSYSVLHAAVSSGSLECVELVMHANCDVNLLFNGTTPLCTAVMHNHLRLCHYLIEHKAHVNHTDNDGSNAQNIAASLGYTDIASLLCEHDANPKEANIHGLNAFQTAFINTKFDTALTIFNHNPSMNVKHILYQISPLSPLIFCIHHQAPAALLKILLHKQCGVDDSNHVGITPLMQACLQNKKEYVEILIEAKADVSKIDATHEGVLHKAFYSGSHDIVELQLQHKAHISRKARTSLDSIARYFNYDHLLELLESDHHRFLYIS